MIIATSIMVNTLVIIRITLSILISFATPTIQSNSIYRGAKEVMIERVILISSFPTYWILLIIM